MTAYRDLCLEMEDAHCIQLKYAQDPDSAYCAVFDGHGGPKFAWYCGKELHLCLQRQESFSKYSMLYMYMWLVQAPNIT